MPSGSCHSLTAVMAFVQILESVSQELPDSQDSPESPYSPESPESIKCVLLKNCKKHKKTNILINMNTLNKQRAGIAGLHSLEEMRWMTCNIAPNP